MNRFEKPVHARKAEHGVVYRNEKEFAGWPFLGGLWKTADGSLLVAFKRTESAYGRIEDVHHDILSVSRGKLTTLRSTDLGRSWDPSSMQVVFDLSATADEITAAGPADYSDEPPVDFLSRDVLVVSGAVPAIFVPQAKPWLRLSSDGGRTWRPTIMLPMSGLPSLSGQGSSMARADGMNLLALTSVTPDGWTRRPLIYASPDGRRWHFLSFMTPIQDDGAAVSEKKGSPRFGAHRYFYPRPIPMPDGRIIASMRSQRDPTSVLWTEMFESDDGGRTWRFMSRVNDWGAPGDIVAMSDGRIACVYGYRLPPFGIRYRVS